MTHVISSRQMARELGRVQRQRNELLIALTSLRNEVAGMFGIAEVDIRAALGNTNAECVMDRLREAEEVMKKVDGRC